MNGLMSVIEVTYRESTARCFTWSVTLLGVHARNTTGGKRKLNSPDALVRGGVETSSPECGARSR